MKFDYLLEELKMRYLKTFFMLIVSSPCYILNMRNKSSWFCTFWGWHLKPKVIMNLSSEKTGVCPRCNCRVYLKNNGSWADYV